MHVREVEKAALDLARAGSCRAHDLFIPRAQADAVTRGHTFSDVGRAQRDLGRRAQGVLEPAEHQQQEQRAAEVEHGGRGRASRGGIIAEATQPGAEFGLGWERSDEHKERR